MAVEVDELYSNLTKLLDDICKFLTAGGNYDKLSPLARKQADELISRSKKQLQHIAKIQKDSEYNGAYVDMERKSEINNEDDKNNIYSSVEEETAVTSSQPVAYPQANPYANLPAKHLSQDIKFGTLSWKYRIILKFEKIRRIYAGIHNNWLLMYSSEKDTKPLQSFDLKFYKAQPVISKQNKSFPQDFELVCTLGERKTYYFLAMTHKDMLQWISYINRCNDYLNKCENTEGSSAETPNMIPETNLEMEDEEEDIYHDIETYSPKVRVTSNKPPDLPARRCIKSTMPLPPLPQKDDTSSVSSTYDPVQSTVSLETNSSFSENEEDAIYEPFVNKPPESKSHIIVVNDKAEQLDDVYVNNVINKRRFSIEKPTLPAKPMVPEKPKPKFAVSKK